MTLPHGTPSSANPSPGARVRPSHRACFSNRDSRRAAARNCFRMATRSSFPKSSPTTGASQDECVPSFCTAIAIRSSHVQKPLRTPAMGCDALQSRSEAQKRLKKICDSFPLLNSKFEKLFPAQKNHSPPQGGHGLQALLFLLLLLFQLSKSPRRWDAQDRTTGGASLPIVQPRRHQRRAPSPSRALGGVECQPLPGDGIRPECQPLPGDDIRSAPPPPSSTISRRRWQQGNLGDP